MKGCGNCVFLTCRQECTGKPAPGYCYMFEVEPPRKGIRCERYEAKKVNVGTVGHVDHGGWVKRHC